MKVIRARAMGMCFGVKDALEATRRVEDPRSVTIHGELVHNEMVLGELRRRGFADLPEEARGLPVTAKVLITAHGVSHRERERLRAAGKEILDTTCPLVARAHRAALRMAADGYLVVLVGRRGHVEVEGLTGDLASSRVVWDPAEVEPWGADRIAVLCQTTTPSWHADRMLQEIRRRNPSSEVRFVDTICRPTKDRQAALEELLERVQALVVVGGQHSNNTRQLGRLAEARGIPALHVQGPADLDPGWLARFETVGLTAGTSTPDGCIEAVHRALLAFQPSPVRGRPESAGGLRLPGSPARSRGRKKVGHAC